MEHIFGLILSMMFGAVFGSYATLFAYRLPRGESCFGRYFGKKSRCPNCDAIIKTRDLIPLINWMMTLGKCRGCGIKIPRIHFFVEAATTTVFAICYLKFSFTESFILYAMVSVGLVILLACDFTHKVFPQPILIFILMVIVAIRAIEDQSILNMVNSGVVGVVCAAIFYQVFYKRATGFFVSEDQVIDYVKFILLASLALNISDLLSYFFCVMIVMTAMLLLNIPRRSSKALTGYALVAPFYLLFLT